jgi:hypothetical protein
MAASAAYILSHNGLGDNLYMVGAVRFIAQYYETVYFLCKQKYHANVDLFFSEKNIHCVPFDESRKEADQVTAILADKYENSDIFVCGCHKAYLTSKITNPEFLVACSNDDSGPTTTVDFDTLTAQNYGFIEGFYKDLGLSLHHFYRYFELPRTSESENLYRSIKDYYVIFIQLSSSCGTSLNLSDLLAKYIDDDRVLLVCNDRNLYTSNNEPVKFALAQPFVYNKIVHYMDTIVNSDEIYTIDSCFTGMVLPLAKMGRLRSKQVRIILRQMAATISI